MLPTHSAHTTAHHCRNCAAASYSRPRSARASHKPLRVFVTTVATGGVGVITAANKQLRSHARAAAVEYLHTKQFASAAAMSTQSKSRVTPLQHTAIGAFGGVVEVCLMQPMMAFKNALQEGRPIPSNPLMWYRGLLINCGSMAPITASQFGTNRIMEQAIAKWTGKDLTGSGRFGAAAVAGAVSSLIGTPTELIIIQQQKKGTGLAAEVRHFFSTYQKHSIFRGLGPCMGREALYAAGYLGLCPVLYDQLKDSPALQEYPHGTAMALSGVAGGVFAAAASHPFDTVKTRMQAFMYSTPEYATAAATAATIYREAGVLTFWRGLLPRMVRIVAATFILINVRSSAVAYLEDAPQ